MGDSIAHDARLGDASPKGIRLGIRGRQSRNLEESSDIFRLTGDLSPFR